MLKFKHLSFAGAAVALFAAYAHGEPPPSPAPTAAAVAQGRTFAENNCASCHAIGVRGVSAHAEAPPLRTLSQNYPIEALDEAFAEGIQTGHPDMPQYQLAPEQINALLAYIESVQEPARRPARPAAVS